MAWFPKAFTQGCTIECKSLAANGDKIREYDVAYFMASIDPVDGEKGNKAFAESEKADFPLLGDPTKETRPPTASCTRSAASPSAGRTTSARTGGSPPSTRRSSRPRRPRT